MCVQQPGKTILQHYQQQNPTLYHWTQYSEQKSNWISPQISNIRPHLYIFIHQNKGKIFSCFVVNLNKTKILIFQERSGNHSLKHQFYLDKVKLERAKNYTYLGLNISSSGNFQRAVNELRDKARRAFYAIKRNITTDIPIKTWLQFFKSVIEPITILQRNMGPAQ